MRKRLLCLAIVGLLGSLALARPGVVKTTDGRLISGDVNEAAGPDGSTLEITVNRAVISVPKSEVASVSYTDGLDSEFAARLAALRPTDVDGRLQLARWALDRRAFDLARQAVQSAVQLSPGNTDAPVLMRTIDAEESLQAHQAVAGATSRSSSSAAHSTTQPEPNFLNPAQVNELRQTELRPDDTVHVLLVHDVVRRYLLMSHLDPATFYQATALQQARQIMQAGDARTNRDVWIMSDPASLAEYRQRIHARVMAGCAASGCHSGGHSDFFLYDASKPAAIYTDFYLLRQYHQNVEIDDAFGAGTTMRPMLDRPHPELSLLVQYGLPRLQATLPHPAVPGWKPMFAGPADPGYSAMVQWIGESLKGEPGALDIDFHPTLPASTGPSAQPTAATRP